MVKKQTEAAAAFIEVVGILCKHTELSSELRAELAACLQSHGLTPDSEMEHDAETEASDG